MSVPKSGSFSHELQDLLEPQVASLLVETAFWGGLSIQFCYALRLIWRTRYDSRIRYWGAPTTIFVLIPILFLYTSSTIVWALDINITISGMRQALSSSLFDDGKRRVAASALFLVNMEIGTGILMWRMFVLWKVERFHHLRIVFTPFLLWLISMSFALTDITCLSIFHFASDNSVSGICRIAGPLVWGFSVGTNLLSAALVGVIIWKRKGLITLGLRKDNGERSLTIFYLLIESGALFVILWISQVVRFISRGSTTSYFSLLLVAMGHQLSAIYPIFILVLLRSRKTVQDMISQPEISFIDGVIDIPVFPQTHKVSVPDTTVDCSTLRSNLGSSAERQKCPSTICQESIVELPGRLSGTRFPRKIPPSLKLDSSTSFGEMSPAGSRAGYTHSMNSTVVFQSISPESRGPLSPPQSPRSLRFVTPRTSRTTLSIPRSKAGYEPSVASTVIFETISNLEKNDNTLGEDDEEQICPYITVE